MKIAPWLSLHSGIALSVIPSSPKSEFTHTNCLHVSDSDIYLASVEESATVRCALQFQLNIPLANFIMYFVVEQ